MTPLLRKLLNMSWTLVFVMFGLLIVGVFTIESAARHLSESGEYYAKKQATWLLLGSVVFFVTALIDYRWIKYLALPMYLIGIVLVIAAFGDNVHRLKIAGISFQPAQFMIISGIILMAWLLQDMDRWHPILGLPFVKLLTIVIVAAIPFALVAKMGDMGSALVWMPVIAIVMLVSGVPFRYLTVMSLSGLILVPIMFFVVLPSLSPRGANRIQVYLDMYYGRKIDKHGDAYGPYYTSMAVGKAGYKGVGHNADHTAGSLHAKGYIPKKTAHNDYVFGVFAEEQGFRGSMFLLMSFSLLLIMSIFVGYYSRDMSGQIICSGIVAMFFAHIFENIGMCVLLMPVTGIPLPFISYSGTFVVTCMFMMGLIQSVWVHRRAQTLASESKNNTSSRGKGVTIRRRGEARENPNQDTQRGSHQTF